MKMKMFLLALHKVINHANRSEHEGLTEKDMTATVAVTVENNHVVDKENQYQGGSECSRGSQDDSQTSPLPVLFYLGSSSDGIRSPKSRPSRLFHGEGEDVDADVTTDMSVNMSPGMSPLIGGTSKYNRASVTPNNKQEKGRISLSKIFTPAHSKSRERDSTETVSQELDEREIELMISEHEIDKREGRKNSKSVAVLDSPAVSVCGSTEANRNGRVDPESDVGMSNSVDNNDDTEEVNTNMSMSVDTTIASPTLSRSPHSHYAASSSHRSQSQLSEQVDVAAVAVARTDVSDLQCTNSAVSTDLSRVEKTLLVARLSAAEREIQSVRAENVRFKAARDSLVVEVTGLRSKNISLVAEISGENTQNIMPK